MYAIHQKHRFGLMFKTYKSIYFSELYNMQLITRRILTIFQNSHVILSTLIQNIMLYSNIVE